MVTLHHSAFIVKDIDSWENRIPNQGKVNDVIDPIQHARLALYKNFGDTFIELIQPLNEKAFTWNALQKHGEQFNHFCYSVNSKNELDELVAEYKLISVLSPVPALLFNGKRVTFYYTRNRQVVEFLIDE
jgi:methylmalonyl-CoA/ethylmalonyl-CoA epimerase